MESKTTRKVRWSLRYLDKGCNTTNPTPDVALVPIPKPWSEPMRCMRLLKSVGGEDMDAPAIGKYSYVCALHWQGGQGPKIDEPDPNSSSLQKMYVSIHYFHLLL